MGTPGTVTAFRVQPFTARRDRIRQRGDHALIGVSTGKGCLSAEGLTALVRWTRQNFRAVDLICADVHIDTMLIAGGADPEEAGRGARKRVKAVRRRIRQAVDPASPDGPVPGSHLLSDFRDVAEYRRLRGEVEWALIHE